MSAKKKVGWALAGSVFLTVLRWVLDDYGYIQLAQDAFNHRGRIVKGVWWLILHPLFGPSVAVGCLAVYLVLEWRTRRIAARLPAAPAEPPVKGFLDYKIEQGQAFEDVLRLVFRYVDIHKKWVDALAVGVNEIDRLDKKTPFSDKTRDLKAKQIGATTAKRLDKITEGYAAHVIDLGSAVDRLSSNQAEYFSSILHHDLDPESLRDMREKFIGFQKGYGVVRDTQASFLKTIVNNAAPTSELIGAGQRFVDCLTRSVAAYKRLDGHVKVVIALLDGKLKAKSKLSLVFDGDKPPYLQELFVTQPGQTEPVWHRIYRVGIRNDSSVVIRDVRVVLESFDHVQTDGLVPPNPKTPVFLEHALNVMGADNKTGVVDVAPGDGPTAFVDVIDQDVDPKTETGDWMSPCYASDLWSGLFSRSTFVLGLRVEGGGHSARAKFTVGATLKDRRIKMVPYALP